MRERIRDWTRARVSIGTRNRIARARVAARAWTGRLRPLPDLLIVGAMRAGTSSIYRYLASHPEAHASLRKEVEYLSAHFDRPVEWYRAHWPILTPGRRERGVCFEASPNYLFPPVAARRAADLLPDARAIVSLRDPVDRAWSHWKHMRRLGFETLDFGAAVDAEEERTAEEKRRAALDPEAPLGTSLLRYAYVERGRYAEQLSRWLDAYGPARVHVVDFAAFRADPGEAMREILAFLRIPGTLPGAFPNYSYPGGSVPATDPAPDPAVRSRLAERFAEPNEALYALLGRRFGWRAP